VTQEVKLSIRVISANRTEFLRTEDTREIGDCSWFNGKENFQTRTPQISTFSLYNVSNNVISPEESVKGSEAAKLVIKTWCFDYLNLVSVLCDFAAYCHMRQKIWTINFVF
jgi:hypothetical protein